MRCVLSLVLVGWLFSFGAGAEEAASWLDRAANASLSLREREYAARQVLMLADPSASILIAALRGDGSESGLRRQVAARLLGELDPALAEAPLLEAAGGRDYFLAEAASSALARLYSRLSDPEIHSLFRRGGRAPGTVPGGAGAGEDDWIALSLAAADAKADFRTLLLRGLALKYQNIDGPLPAPLAECVWRALADSSRKLRESALALAARCPGGDAAEKVAAFLYTESDPRLLAIALRSMAGMRPAEFGAAVERHVGHDDPMVQLEALAALDAMGYENALLPPLPGARAVAGFVSHPSTPVRRRAIDILAGSRNAAVLEYLRAGLFDRVGQNRAAAAAALGELGFAVAVGWLSPLLNDDRPEARSAAAVALSRLGVVGVAVRVLGDLEGGDLVMRRAAARTLGELGDSRAGPALVRVLADDDAELACLAAEALAALRYEEARELLYRLLVSSGDPVRADAARRSLADIFLDDPGASQSRWESWARRNRVEP